MPTINPEKANNMTNGNCMLVVEKAMHMSIIASIGNAMILYFKFFL